MNGLCGVLNTQNIPSNVWTEIFATNHPLSSSLNQWAALGRYRAVEVKPLSYSLRADINQSSECTLPSDRIAGPQESLVLIPFHATQRKAMLYESQSLLQSLATVENKAMLDGEKEKAKELTRRFREALAQRLRHAIDGRVTDAEIAELCGVTKQAVSGWKKTGRIHKKHLVKIAIRTGFQINYFLLEPEAKAHDFISLSDSENAMVLAFRDIPDEDKKDLLEKLIELADRSRRHFQRMLKDKYGEAAHAEFDSKEENSKATNLVSEQKTEYTIGKRLRRKNATHKRGKIKK